MIKVQNVEDTEDVDFEETQTRARYVVIKEMPELKVGAILEYQEDYEDYKCISGSEYFTFYKAFEEEVVFITDVVEDSPEWFEKLISIELTESELRAIQKGSKVSDPKKRKYKKRKGTPVKYNKDLTEDDVKRYIEFLKPIDKDIIERYVLNGESYNSIANRLNTTYFVVQKHKSLAMQAIRKMKADNR